MARSLVVVGAIVAVIVVLNYRAPEDPVREIAPAPLAAGVSALAPFPVYLPTDDGWRPTAARWEPTEESAPEAVWFVGGVYSEQGPFASLNQSTATSAEYLAELVGEGPATGSSTVGDVQWQRYETSDQRSLVQLLPDSSIVVVGDGTWDDLERFAGSLEPAQDLVG